MIKAKVNQTPIDIRKNNVKVVKGEKGAVFTPHIDEESNLSWTNNGDLINPPTVNIRGKDGEANITSITNKEIEAIIGGI